MTALRALKHPFGFEWGGTAEVTNAGSWLKQTILQWILTSQRERVHRPNYGGNLYNLVFENTDEDLVDAALIRIQDGIERRFQVEVLKINPMSDNYGTLRIEIEYLVGGVPDQLTVDLTDVIR